MLNNKTLVVALTIASCVTATAANASDQAQRRMAEENAAYFMQKEGKGKLFDLSKIVDTGTDTTQVSAYPKAGYVLSPEAGGYVYSPSAAHRH